jgi:hypothetical protein
MNGPPGQFKPVANLTLPDVPRLTITWKRFPEFEPASSGRLALLNGMRTASRNGVSNCKTGISEYGNQDGKYGMTYISRNDLTGRVGFRHGRGTILKDSLSSQEIAGMML